MKRRNIVSLTVLCVLSLAVTASATEWTAGTGAWENPANWDEGVPGLADNAQIENGGTAQSTGPTNAARYLTVGSAAGDGTIDLSGGDLTVDQSTYLGNGGGTGTINVSGGAVYNAQYMYIGSSSGATGYLTVSGTSSELVVTNRVDVSSNGDGELVIDDGGKVSVESVGVYMCVGHGTVGMITITNGGSMFASALRMAWWDNQATINLAGDLDVPYETYIGGYGTGTLNQVSGTFSCGHADSTSAYGLYIGAYAGGVGSYTISGGTLIALTGAYTDGQGGLSVGGWADTDLDATFKVVGNGATITVENYNQFYKGTLVAEIDTTGISVINVSSPDSTNGVANLSGTFEVVDSGAAEGIYTILVASNGVNGTFDTVFLPSSEWGIEYGSNTVSVIHTAVKSISLTSTGSGSEVKMVFDAPTPSAVYPYKKTNLVFDPSWVSVPHSDVSGGTYVETNLSYSTPVSGTANKIYLKTTNDVAFFGIGQ